MTNRGNSGVLAAALISTLVVNVNSSAVTILLPAMSADTGSSITVLQWAVTGYALVGAATIVVSGALGDLLGRRKVFLYGLGLFVASCIVIAVAHSATMIIAGRCLQGAAGAAILACGLSLLSTAYSGSGQLRAVAYWGAGSSLGAAIGPLAGGGLVVAGGWQGLFWIDALVAGVCVPIVLTSVSESRDPDRPRTIDVGGALLIASTLAPLILALSEGQNWGWLSARTIACLAVSIVSAAAFVVVERHHPAPLVDLSLLRNRILIGATLTVLIAAGARNGLIYVISIYFQDPQAMAMTALHAGLAVLPVAATIVLLAPAVSPIVSRIGTSRTIAIGSIIMAGAFIGLAFVTPSWSYLTFVLPLIGIAVGMSLQNNPATSTATACVRREDVGAASGISNMARYTGIGLMTSITATVYDTVHTRHIASGQPANQALADGLSATSITMAIWCVAGIALAGLIIKHRQPKPHEGDHAVATANTIHTVPAPQPSPTREDRQGAIATDTV